MWDIQFLVRCNRFNNLDEKEKNKEKKRKLEKGRKGPRVGSRNDHVEAKRKENLREQSAPLGRSAKEETDGQKRKQEEPEYNQEYN